MLLVKRDELSVRNSSLQLETEGINFSLKGEQKKAVKKTAWRKRPVSQMSFTDWFWEVSSPSGLFYSLERENHRPCPCYLLFDLKCYHAGYALSTTRLLKMKPSIILNDFLLEDFFLLDTESQQSVFNFSQMQVAKSSTIPSETDVTDLCCILYNKPHIIATFFFQQKTAFELFIISPQISFLGKQRKKSTRNKTKNS